MGSSGKGGGGTDWNMVAGENAYNAAANGASLESLVSAAPQYADAMTQGYNMYLSDKSQQDMISGLLSGFGDDPGQTAADDRYAKSYWKPSDDPNGQAIHLFEGDEGWNEQDLYRYGEPPGAESVYQDGVKVSVNDKATGKVLYYFGSDGQMYTEQDRTNRDTLYENYLGAVDTATDNVNSRIESERANANLLGVDYTMTDEQKKSMISDELAGIWSDTDQTQLETYFNDYGTPDGFGGFLVERGTVEEQPTKEIKPRSSTGSVPGTVLTDDEDLLGGKTSILGG